MVKKILKMKFLLVFFVFLWGNLSYAQDCRVAGEGCSDDKSCCGGCCMGYICKDTYMDCRTVGLPMDDPCLDTYCPPEEICYTYQPPMCKGCGPITACRSTEYVPDEYQINITTTNHALSNISDKIVNVRFITVAVFINLFL